MSFKKNGDASMIGKPIEPKDLKSEKKPKKSDKDSDKYPVKVKK